MQYQFQPCQYTHSVSGEQYKFMKLNIAHSVQVQDPV